MQPCPVSVCIPNSVPEHTSNSGKNARVFRFWFLIRASVNLTKFFRLHPNQLQERETIRQQMAQLFHPQQIRVLLRQWDLLHHPAIPRQWAPLRLLRQAPAHLHQVIPLGVQPSLLPINLLQVQPSLLLISLPQVQPRLLLISLPQVQPRLLLISLPQVQLRLQLTLQLTSLVVCSPQLVSHDKF